MSMKSPGPREAIWDRDPMPFITLTAALET